MGSCRCHCRKKLTKSELVPLISSSIFLQTYLSPVTSVTYPIGIPPPRSASIAGSSVLIVLHRDAWSFVEGPGVAVTVSGLMLELGSASEDGPMSARLFSNPRSAWSASMTWAESRRTSAGGTWARFAISSVSSVMRSTVVILLRSSGGIICAYDFVEKSGRTDRRSIRMQGNGQVGDLLARRDYPSFYRVGPITASLQGTNDKRGTSGQTRFDSEFLLRIRIDWMRRNKCLN